MKHPFFYLVIWLITAILPAMAPAAPPEPISAEQAREEYAYTLGVQAYIYGYPLVEMYRVRHKAVFDPANKNRTPLNQFRHMRALFNHTAATVVAPNNDTLYSSAWLDLAQEPLVLEVPDTQGRYYVMQFMDFYTNNFAYVGKRATGTKPGRYAITGPNWHGALPKGLRQIQAPTNAVWLLGRTLVDGQDDLPAAHAIQDQYRLTPLSAWHKKARPDSAPAAPPPAYDPGDPLRFYEWLDNALSENPPPAREAALMSLFGQIGVGPGKAFQAASLDQPTANGLRRAVDVAPRLLASLSSGQPANGWQAFLAHTGRFGDDYRYRAYVAKTALASNSPEEAYNYSIHLDSQGEPLNGNRKYVVRFEPGQLPPVEAFWSLSLYRFPSLFFAENPLARYSLGDRSRELRYAKDGSLEIYIQQTSPGEDKASNWLPAPVEDIALVLRCYLPRPAISNGAWIPPAVIRVE